MAEELNKLELLVKVMKMTTVAEDSMATVAIRKANAMLAAEGWDWDKLLRGKVRVIADPFANLSTPDRSTRNTAHRPPTPPPQQPAPRQPMPKGAFTTPPRPKPAPPPQPKAPPSPPRVQSNRFPGHCHQCNARVEVGDGFIQENRSRSGWDLFCGRSHLDDFNNGRPRGKWASRRKPVSNLEDLL